MNPPTSRPPWWKSIGPALITACVVFGPGSLVINANIGATYGYELLWLLLLAGVLMGTYTTMSARIGVTTGASHFGTLRKETSRPFAMVLGLVLCLTCGSFQFSNNLAVALVAGAFAPDGYVLTAQIGGMALLNLILAIIMFRGGQVYLALERVVKVMVGIVLCSFTINLILSRPNLLDILKGGVPHIPENLSLGIPGIVDGIISDPLVLIASLFGTTFSVAGAFFQGNLVREKGWTREDYDRGVGDAVAGIGVLTLISAIIMITGGTVILGKPADSLASLAGTLQPLLGTMAFTIFCIGLFPVALNPFLINAMIGGTALADGLGLPGKFSDFWPRVFTVVVLLSGFSMASLGLWKQVPPVNLMIFGQAMTVIGNPLMAGTLLWLANRESLMGARRNRIAANVLGGAGLLVVLLLAVRMLWFLYLRISLLMAG
ncbi:MAG: Divalent metal cation transporter MntH [Candidatus Hydrogenedentes bacterium ADurb.Bin101]|nr:MAG: Divalent metal cation transporter MntH [Candidatus Hydrogenedentes bacterium ADurb.Bin101]